MLFRIAFPIIGALAVWPRLCSAMLMPADTEILPGYEMDDIAPDGSGLFFELRSLTADDRRMPIRNRRDTEQYAVLESPGLRSHFVVNKRVASKKVLMHSSMGAAPSETRNDEYMQNIAYVNLRPPKRESGGGRKGRSVSEADTLDASVENETAAKDTEELEADEALPVAARLTMSSSDDYPGEKQLDQNEAGSSLLDSWHDGTYLYARRHDDHSDGGSVVDSPPMPPSFAAATSNEGIKGRMPRVHFITQKSRSDEQQPESKSAASAAAKTYRSVPQKRDDGGAYGTALRPSASARYHNYDVFEAPSSFDGYDREMLLQPESYLRASSTASVDYIPTRPPTYADYFYSERRFDLPPPPAPLPPLPHYREHSRTFDNRYADDRYLPAGPAAGDLKPPRNRRIIYYATLPEIVRSPPPPPPPTPISTSLYRSGYNSRYDYPGYSGYGGYEYDRYYRSVRAEKPPTSSLKDGLGGRGAVKSNRPKPFLDGSVRIASTLTVNDAPPGKALKSTPATKRPLDYGRYF